MLTVFKGTFLDVEYIEDETSDPILAKVKREHAQESIEECKISIDVADIENINESDLKGYLTVRMKSGYAFYIKSTIEKLTKMHNEAISEVSDKE